MNLIHKISGLRQMPSILGERIYFIDRKSEKLIALDKKTFDIAFHLDDKIPSLSIFQNLILCYGLNIYNLEGSKIYSGDAQYSYENVYFESLTLWKLVDNEKETVSYHVFDTVHMSFNKKDIVLGAVPFLFLDKYVFTRKAQIITCKNIESDTTLWQFDISQFGTYKDKKIFTDKDPEVRQREINRVYYYNNKIIITLSRAIIALNPDNGELLWKIDFENYDPVNLLFDGNIAYLGRLIYFAIIDIEKGIKLFEKDFDPAYRFEVEGFKLSQIRYIGLTLHENHLWFTHEDKGHQFLLKANPQNGDIINGMLLETKLSTYPPLFDENRMYLLDQEGVLWIYEIDGND